VFLTGVWSVGSTLVATLSQFVTVPFFLKAWGSEIYGEWLTLSSVVAYIALSDAGMQTYVVNHLTQQYVRGEWAALEQSRDSATAMYVFTIGLAAAAVAALCISPVGRLVPALANAGVAAELTALLGAQVAITVFAGYAGGYYRVQGLADYSQFAFLLSRSGLLVATLGILAIRGSSTVLAVGQLLMTALATLVVVVDVTRRDPRLRFSLKHANWRIAASFLGPSLWVLLGAISAGLTVQGTVLVCAAMLNAGAVVTFSTTRTLANAVRQITGVFNTSLAPEITRIEAAGARSRLATVHGVMVKVASAVATVLVAWLFWTGPFIYRTWTRGRAQVAPGLLRLLLIDQLLATPWSTSASVLVAVNNTKRVRALTLRMITAGTIGVIGLIPLLPRTGLYFIGIVTLCCNILFMSLAVPSWTQEQLGEPLTPYVVRIYAPLIGIGATTIVAVYLVARLLPSGIFGVLLLGLVASAVAFPLYWLVCLSHDERSLLRGLSARILRRRTAG